MTESVATISVETLFKMYGEKLCLIIRLEPMERSQLLKLDRLDGSYNIQNILDVDIIEITLPVAPGRNLAILLECAVRNHALRTRGYNAPEEFIQKQLRLISQKSGQP
jgi:HPr kinase/phosphorylase